MSEEKYVCSNMNFCKYEYCLLKGHTTKWFAGFICHNYISLENIHGSADAVPVILNSEPTLEDTFELDEFDRKIEDWRRFAELCEKEYEEGKKKYGHEEVGSIDIIKLVLGKHFKWYTLGTCLNYLLRFSKMDDIKDIDRFKGKRILQDLRKAATYLQQTYMVEEKENN